MLNFQKVAEMAYGEQVELEVVDILEDPALAEADHIIAVPALVRISPTPIIKIIGDLSNTVGLKAFFGI
jgi:circadian clock protein KaiB